jgi:CO dehydrogenase/acetyl-CoA synthase beta subunit
MVVFDPYIKKISDYLEVLKSKERRIKVFNSTYLKIKENLPFTVGKNANSGIILRQDTFVELGNPEAGSSSFLLFTEDNSLITDGKITIVGPDITESEGKSLPFGQVLIIGGKKLSNKDHAVLMQTGYIGDQIEGYMIRSLSQNIWSRVSRSAVLKGLDFENLGKAIISVYKSGSSAIDAMEVLFITSSKEDIKLMDNISIQIQKISREIIRENWKLKGYDIDCELDCNSCSDKTVCDDIREVLKDKMKTDKTVNYN